MRFLDQRCDKSFTFSAGSTVADRDQINVMILTELDDLLLGLSKLGVWLVWVDHIDCQHLAAFINDR